MENLFNYMINESDNTELINEIIAFNFDNCTNNIKEYIIDKDLNELFTEIIAFNLINTQYKSNLFPIYYLDENFIVLKKINKNENPLLSEFTILNHSFNLEFKESYLLENILEASFSGYLDITQL